MTEVLEVFKELIIAADKPVKAEGLFILAF